MDSTTLASMVSFPRNKRYEKLLFPSDDFFVSMDDLPDDNLRCAICKRACDCMLKTLKFAQKGEWLELGQRLRLLGWGVDNVFYDDERRCFIIKTCVGFDLGFTAEQHNEKFYTWYCCVRLAMFHAAKGLECPSGLGYSQIESKPLTFPELLKARYVTSFTLAKLYDKYIPNLLES